MPGLTLKSLYLLLGAEMRLRSHEAQFVHSGTSINIPRFKWEKVMDGFGKETLHFKISYIVCLSCKDWVENNGMQVSSFWFLNFILFFESEPASSFHSENSAAIVQSCVFLFVSAHTWAHIHTDTVFFYYLKYFLFR